MGEMVSVAQVKLDEKLMMEPDGEQKNIIAVLPTGMPQTNAPPSSVADRSADADNPIFSAVNMRDPYPQSIALQMNVVSV